MILYKYLLWLYACCCYIVLLYAPASYGGGHMVSGLVSCQLIGVYFESHLCHLWKHVWPIGITSSLSVFLSVHLSVISVASTTHSTHMCNTEENPCEVFYHKTCHYMLILGGKIATSRKLESILEKSLNCRAVTPPQIGLLRTWFLCCTPIYHVAYSRWHIFSLEQILDIQETYLGCVFRKHYSNIQIVDLGVASQDDRSQGSWPFYKWLKNTCCPCDLLLMLCVCRNICITMVWKACQKLRYCAFSLLLCCR